MRVLIITSSLPNGGKERQIIELTNGLIKADIEVKIISFSHINNAVGINLIAEHLIIIDKRKGYFKVQQEYYSEILKYKPDVVHAWDHISAMLSVLPKIVLRFILIDGSIRGAKRYFKRRLYMLFTYLFTDIVVANSIAGLKSARKKLNKKNIVIYNGFDSTRIERINDRFDFKQGLAITDRKVVGMVANIRPAKDYHGFLKLAETVLMQEEDVVFVSIGQGKIDQELINNLNENVKNRIHFLGRIENTEEYIKSFDIGILLNDTRYGMEGISNAIMEYMAMGKPVVATNAGGNPEIVLDGESGFLVPAFNIKETASKIIALLGSEKLKEQFGNKGKEIIENRFSLKKMINSYIHLYKELSGLH